MLEIKHTNKDFYKISRGNLKNRIKYAKEHNLPLRFAISIKGVWGWFTSEYIEKHNRVILDANYLKDSYLDRELGTCSYFFLKPIKIVSVYSNDNLSGLNVRYEPYGTLISYEFYCDNRLVFRFDCNEKSKLLHMLVLETVQDRLANISHEIIKEDNVTIVDYSKDPPGLFAEYMFIRAIINKMDFNGQNSSDNSFISVNENLSVPCLAIRKTIQDLYNWGVPILGMRDGVGYEFSEYVKEFWSKNNSM